MPETNDGTPIVESSDRPLPKPVDSMATTLENTAAKNIFIFIFQEVASYIRYSQRVPMFLGFFMMLMFILTGLQFNNFETLTRLILRPFVDANGNGHYGTADLLWLYGKVSFGLYIVGSLTSLVLNLIYKKDFELHFKSKMKIAIIVAAIGHTLAGILWAMSPTKSSYSILIVAFILTIIASAYAFMIDAIFDYFGKFLKPAVQDSEEQKN